MDAREQLRRFLEQRREAGETELVFDALSADEALRILKGQRGAKSDEKQTNTLTSGDWREVLREAGAAPDAPQQRLPPPVAALEGQVADAPDNVPLEELPAGIVVGSAGKELFGAASPFSTLNEVVEAVTACTLCPLHRSARNPVPGEGSQNAQLVCVGEAPGATEDELGRPFVGQAGQLLEKILGAIGLAREDVYICNVLKHRPPGNRNPMPDEVQACSPYLIRQIEIIRPRVILALGTFAAHTLLNTREGIGKLRGRIHRYHGVPLIVTYHPAALLRNPAWKRPTWDDVKLAKRILDRSNA